MNVNRARFLELSILLATAGCERGQGAQPLTPAPLDPPAPSASPPIAPGAPSATASARRDAGSASTLSCDNTVGKVDCALVGPACEGMHEECVTLDQDLRPRVAEQFAKCFASAKGPRCRDRSLGACMRRAIESACIEPGATQRCQSVMNACTKAKRAPKYTLEQCEKILSAVNPSPNPADWDRVDAERLGPSFDEGRAAGCSLEYVLPYQPYGGNWR